MSGETKSHRNQISLKYYFVFLALQQFCEGDRSRRGWSSEGGLRVHAATGSRTVLDNYTWVTLDCESRTEGQEDLYPLPSASGLCSLTVCPPLSVSTDCGSWMWPVHPSLSLGHRAGDAVPASTGHGSRVTSCSWFSTNEKSKVDEEKGFNLYSSHKSKGSFFSPFL